MMLDIIIKGDKRSIIAKKNMLASAAIKGADTLVHLLLLPITLGYLNAYEYGIWLTLNSFLSWINAFDIGLGSGLRNKLGEAIANNDREKGKAYVSTTFCMLIFLTIIIFIIGYIAIDNINWYALLNVNNNSVGNLRNIILLSFFFFCVNFIFKFVGNIYQALQLPAVNSLISFIGNLTSLIVIYILTKVSSGSLLLVALIYSLTPPLVYIIFYPITFVKLYPYLSPKLRFFDKLLLKDLLSLSLLFFVFQIMGIILFSLSNIIISNIFGPEEVTPYNIAYRYFSILLMVSNLLMSPIWAAATDAYAKNDLNWIRNSVFKIRKMLSVTILVIVVMILLSPIAYRLWIGTKINISLTLSIVMGVYVFILLWSLSYSSILNGMSKLRLQAINIIFQGILFYPVCYIFAMNYGTIGIVVGMCLVNIPGAILNTLQLNKILNGTAYGIWNK